MSTPRASWPIFITKLKDRREVAERTMAFFFEKPTEWTFKAGQFINMTLISPAETNSEGNRRSFSIASAPHEDILMIATRMRDTAFKRSLGTMPLGTKVKVEGPFGNLNLHHDAARAGVFLAGGIGITPFRSIVLRAAEEKLGHYIFLFYSNRRPEDAPFLEELQALEKNNPNYKFIVTMTGMEKSRQPWPGETGWIIQEMLAKYLNAAASPIYYVAGPPAMVSALRAMLNSAGIDGGDIRTEKFSGY